ncbi:PQQ-binding-like beta-propeller repeat protein [uncultured Jatrophihabitans sp.]|uniref:outer membrane protein assembly factor BamB family protein n=1 Tax=uncultured Jatrophihabitans sp. TaxID=1610747 RepID=UPI0035CA6B81
MSSSGSRRGLIALGVAAVTLAGCSGSSPTVGAPTSGGPKPTTYQGRWLDSALHLRGPVSVVDGIALASTGEPGQSDPPALAAVDAATGRVLWRVKVAPYTGAQHNGPELPLGFHTARGALAVDVELTAKSQARLVGRAARTGAVRWTVSLPSDDASFDFSSLVRCATAVCLSVGNGLRAVDPATGRTRWTRSVKHADVGRPIYSGAGIVVTSGADFPLRAFSAGTGRPLWAIRAEPTTNAELDQVDTSPYPSRYVLGHELIAVGTHGSVGTDLRTGHIEWTRPGWRLAGPGQPTVADDGVTLATTTVLATDGDGRLVALRSDGSVAWQSTHSGFADDLGDQLGWSADLSQVWVVGDDAMRTGYRTSDGAALSEHRGPPLVLTPVDYVPALLKPRSVRWVSAAGAPVPWGVTPSAPAWAGPAGGVHRLVDGPDGSLTGFRVS